MPCSTFPARPQASRCWICLGFRPLKAPRPRIWHPIFRPLSEAARDAVAVARGLLALMKLMKGRWAIVEIPWSRTIDRRVIFFWMNFAHWRDLPLARRQSFWPLRFDPLIYPPPPSPSEINFAGFCSSSIAKSHSSTWCFPLQTLQFALVRDLFYLPNMLLSTPLRFPFDL